MWLTLGTLVVSFTLAFVGTSWVRRWASARGVVDRPDSQRKVHNAPIPLGGGLAIFFAVTATVWYLALTTGVVLGKDISLKALIGITLAGAIVMLGGYMDDRYHLPPKRQLLWSMAAILIVIISGVGVKAVTNPFGGMLHLDVWKIEVGRLAGVPYYFTVAADMLTFLWLLGMMYTTKLLDGLDGLATGIGAIGSLIVFGLTQFTPFYQPSIGLVAIALAGACLGFLLWNWHPARVFLGEGGSLYLGFMLGVLSIISGAKIATALLVMGIPILDVAWVIVRRLFWEKKSIAEADRKHLHYRLLDIGLSHRQAVVLLYACTATFGISSLFLRTKGKIFALGLLALIMALIVSWLLRRQKKEDPSM